jgi:hypothetical protein
VKAPLLVAALGASALALTASGAARADTSAWFTIGGGTSVWKQETTARPTFGAEGCMNIDAGVGTTPDGPVIVGALFRIQPLVQSGADLGLLLRGATHGFQAGKFGLALDLGGYERFWGFGSTGFMGDLVLGAPLGFQLALGGQVGTDKAVATTAVLGFDVLRLTVYRQWGLGTWSNPSPAQHAQAQRKGLFAALF